MDNYEVGKRIGRGNYGTVFITKDRRNSRYYCLKKIEMEAFSEEERAQAHEEVHLLRKLDHPGIVKYHEHFITDDTLCVVMAYCEGGDLAQVIKRRAKAQQCFAEHEVLDWFIQLVLALDYVHNQRILHRDLKTSNIFISKAGHVRMGDFGIAKVLDGTSGAASTVIGTPYYMSPEVCQGQHYDYKSDVWALGCILYEICALQQAWSGSNLLGLVYKIVQEKQPPLPDHYSDELKNLVSHMLAKDPKARPTLRDILVLRFVRARMEQLFAPPTAGRPPSASAPNAAAPGMRTPSRPPSAEMRKLPAPSSTPSAASSYASALPSSSARSSFPSPAPRNPHSPAMPMHPVTPAAASKPSLMPICRASASRGAAAAAASFGTGATGAHGGGSGVAASLGGPCACASRSSSSPHAPAQASSHSGGGSYASPVAPGRMSSIGGGGMGGMSGMPSAIPSEEPHLPDVGLTPKQRMQQRKLAVADRRSVEVQAALARRGPDQELARRIAAKAFSSDLAIGLSSERRPSSGAGDTMRAPSGPLISSFEVSSAAPGGAAQPSPVSYSTNYAEDGPGGGRAAAALGGTLRHGGGTVRRADSFGVADEDYGDDFEDDFEDDEVEEDLATDQPTVAQANLQAEARSIEHAEANQRRLQAVAREAYESSTRRDANELPAALAAHASLSSEVPEEVPTMRSSRADTIALRSGPPASGPPGSRREALQERCWQALGDLFPPVYDYLKVARAHEATERDVRENLLAIVGRDRVNNCMCVDELIFVESNY